MTPPPEHSSSRLIHISDVHCTTKDYTYNVNKGAIAAIAVGAVFGVPIPADPAHGDDQDTRSKCQELVGFFAANAHILRTNRIVITGDLLDSADEEEAKPLAQECLLGPLDESGFEVIVVPGNHDYFRMGNQITTDRIATGRASFFDAFSVYSKAAAPDAYPVDLNLGDGNHLVLVDSLKGHYDVETDSHLAQGNIGRQQMDWLRATLPGYQPGRAVGSKVVVALHHNPFEADGSLEITDAAEFLGVVAGQIDALLFGHTGLPHQFYEDQVGQQAIPIITSENIESMSSTGYLVSVIDLNRDQVEVYSTGEGLLAVEGRPDMGGIEVAPVNAAVEGAYLYGSRGDDAAVMLEALALPSR